MKRNNKKSILRIEVLKLKKGICWEVVHVCKCFLESRMDYSGLNVTQ